LGVARRLSTLVRQKTHFLLDKFENPVQALDYSFERHKEMINKLRRDIAEILTAKKRLEMQKGTISKNISELDAQARYALSYKREDLARLALERKNTNMLQLQKLNNQICGMQVEKEKLEALEKRLSAKIDEIRTRIEIIKARYSATEAEVRIKESATGITEEISNLGLALRKAEDKLERLKAKSQALDEMIDSGILTDYGSNKDEIENELEKIAIQGSVEDELVKLKGQIDLKKKRKKQTTEEQEENGGAEDRQKEEQEIACSNS
jgi:phage shock protein A